MLPPGLESRLVRSWIVQDADALADDLRPLVDAEGRIADASLQRRAPRRGREAWIEGLRRSGAIRAEWSLRQPEVSARRVRVVRALESDANPLRRAPVQRAMLDALGDGERTVPELAEELGMAPSALLAPARRLEAAGRVELGWRTIERDPLAHRSALAPLRKELVAEQRAALDAIAGLTPGGELLLEGVAASGKTDVYLAAVQETLDGGRGAIVLVPEVSLIPQIADRLRAVVGDALAVLHSGLSRGSVMTSGGGSCAARRAPSSEPGPPSSRRSMQGSSSSTRSTTADTSRTGRLGTMPAGSLAGEPSLPAVGWSWEPRRPIW
jgi:hypothetical protein